MFFFNRRIPRYTFHYFDTCIFQMALSKYTDICENMGLEKIIWEKLLRSFPQESTFLKILYTK